MEDNGNGAEKRRLARSERLDDAKRALAFFGLQRLGDRLDHLYHETCAAGEEWSWRSFEVGIQFLIQSHGLWFANPSIHILPDGYMSVQWDVPDTGCLTLDFLYDKEERQDGTAPSRVSLYGGVGNLGMGAVYHLTLKDVCRPEPAKEHLKTFWLFVHKYKKENS